MKKKYTFEVGQQVVTFLDENESEFTSKPFISEYSSGPCYGKVVALEGSKVRVNFKDKYLNDTTRDPRTGAPEGYEPALVAASALMPAEEGKVLFSQLEQEFKAVEKQIQGKLKVAAQAIREANKLAKKELGQSLNDMGAGYGPLYSAMDAAGWRTSSFGC